MSDSRAANVRHIAWPGLAAGIAGTSAVLLGALGAHALRGELSPALLEVWHTAVRFQVWHALALGLATFVARRSHAGHLAAILFAIGIVLFCGSLYALALGAPRWVGIVTPLGGIALVAGWIALGVALYRNRE